LTPKHLEELYSLGMSNIKLGLSNIKRILSGLDNPHNHPRIIHFAGTNGKGSTLVVLEKLLLKSGYTVGSTISPHLVKFNERFRIDGKSIDDHFLDLAFLEICQVCKIDPENFAESAQKSEIRPTFFEFSIAIAFLLFSWKKVDFILLETGLGGRLDATNVVLNPLACVLTKIAIDHQEYLGDSIEEITQEKLGIVKKEAKVFVANQDKKVKILIDKYFNKNNIKYKKSPDDFGFRQHF